MAVSEKPARVEQHLTELKSKSQDSTVHGSNAEQSAEQRLGALESSTNHAAAARLNGAADLGMQEGREDRHTGEETGDSSEAAAGSGDADGGTGDPETDDQFTDAAPSSSLSAVGAALGATLRGFVQKLTMSFGQLAPEADEVPGRDPAAAGHAAEGHAESALLANRGTASRSSMFGTSSVGRGTLSRSGNDIKEPAISRTPTKKATSFKLPEFKLSEVRACSPHPRHPATVRENPEQCACKRWTHTTALVLQA